MRTLSETEYRSELIPLLTRTLRELDDADRISSPYFTPDVWEPFRPLLAQRLLFYTVMAALPPRHLYALMHAARQTGDNGLYLYQVATRTPRERTPEERRRNDWPRWPGDGRPRHWRTGPNYYFPLGTGAEIEVFCREYVDLIDVDEARGHVLISPAARWVAVVYDGHSWAGGSVTFVERFLADLGESRQTLTAEFLGIRYGGRPRDGSWLRPLLTHAYGAAEAERLLAGH